MSKEVLTSLVGPILVALVSLSGAWWKEAAQRRNREKVRQRLLAYVKDKIAVIEAWIKAHASLEPSAAVPEAVRARARHNLDMAYNRMSQLVPEPRYSITLQTLVSRLLLRHLPMTPAVRWRRYVYYVTPFMAVIWGFAGFTMPDAWNSSGNVFATLATYLLLAVLPAWLASRFVVSAARGSDSAGGT
jgi:hypothetical protein